MWAWKSERDTHRKRSRGTGINIDRNIDRNTGRKKHAQSMLHVDYDI